MQKHFSLQVGALIWNGERIPFKTLSEILAGSDWGSRLKAIIRFEEHRPKEIDPQIWAKAIGMNGNDLSHQLRVAKIMAKWVSQIPGLDPESAATLILAELFHDSGEAATPFGDVQSGKKTAAQAIEELHALRRVLTEVFNRAGYPGLGQSIHAKISPVLNRSSVGLSRIHEILTASDHFHTALRAWNVAKRLDHDPTFQAGLRKLVYNVFGRTIQPLTKNGRFRPLHTTLLRKTGLVSEIFEELNLVPDPVRELYEQHEQGSAVQAQLRFFAAADAWLDWLEENPPAASSALEVQESILAYQT